MLRLFILVLVILVFASVTITAQVGINTTTPLTNFHIVDTPTKDGDVQLGRILLGGDSTSVGNAGTSGQILQSNGAEAASWVDSPTKVAITGNSNSTAEVNVTTTTGVDRSVSLVITKRSLVIVNTNGSMQMNSSGGTNNPTRAAMTMTVGYTGTSAGTLYFNARIILNSSGEPFRDAARVNVHSLSSGHSVILDAGSYTFTMNVRKVVTSLRNAIMYYPQINVAAIEL